MCFLGLSLGWDPKVSHGKIKMRFLNYSGEIYFTIYCLYYFAKPPTFYPVWCGTLNYIKQHKVWANYLKQASTISSCQMENMEKIK